jgi:tetratricopeptide (TPR) repeat protein
MKKKAFTAMLKSDGIFVARVKIAFLRVKIMPYASYLSYDHHEARILKLLIEELKGFETWQLLRLACEARLAGSRKAAFDYINDFIALLLQAAFPAQKAFAIWFCEKQAFLIPNLSVTKLRLSDVSHDLVLPTLQKWSELEPSNPVPFHWLGLFYNGYLPNSEEILKKALELDPTDELVAASLVNGAISRIWGAMHNAPYHYSGNPLEDFENLQAHKRLLAIIHDPQIYTKLNADFQELEKKVQDWLNSIAMQYQDLENYSATIAAYNVALQSNPNQFEAYLGRAGCHLLLGEVQEALADYSAALNLRPGLYNIYVQRGIVYSTKLQEYEAALADFNHAITLRPYPFAYLVRGRTYKAMGNIAAAREDLQKAADSVNAEAASELLSL